MVRASVRVRANASPNPKPNLGDLSSIAALLYIVLSSIQVF